MSEWAVMFGDTSVMSGFNGPRARSYCEAVSLRLVGSCDPVLWDGYEWQFVAPRNRFTVHAYDDPNGWWLKQGWRNPLYVECSLCGYRSAPSGRVFAPVKAFEDHWHDVHGAGREQRPPWRPPKPWWERLWAWVTDAE